MFPYLIEEKELKKSSKSESPKKYTTGDKYGDNCKITTLQYSPQIDQRLESKNVIYHFSNFNWLQFQLQCLQSQVLQNRPPKNSSGTKKNTYMILNQKLLER